ncbi:aromatic amino acid aminotransferase I [Kwoniella heveanensis CBS 569]|uniref:Aromatic amino acid aminotransferase I n=1 Tax=Kwoniella heveanensis BCC8398 TaxID=1296120 RepID=A0A1B9GWR6_9TREE|nr:aromatic amino acid aminotransferase I [Kwoniella heveanensis BCC8398]OCF41323.1 aromatic amino acid aminotransferase I [Kwoniella heveanensis CBS 569]
MDSAYDFSTGSRAQYEVALPKAKDFTDHLNRVTKNRAASTLKELYKYQSVPGMIVMAGGIPHPEVFPFETLSATVLAHDAFPLDPPRVPKKNKSVLSWLFSLPKPTISFTIPKYAPKPTDATTIQLSSSLQYAAATGPPALPLFLREYVSKVYRPAYADWDVLVNVGATDGWSKIVNMLVELGDAILVEEWTYPSAENTFLAYECERVPVKMDAEGILPEILEKVLSEWDEEKRGKRRPRILYTIPTGQNPTGATMQLDRKKQVYEICSRFDVIICEDEPYYCLYTGEWTPKGSKSDRSVLEQRLLDSQKKEGPEGNEAYIKSLPPSYLNVDTEGRVIRMDTFSKTSAPGSRLGWITANPLFIERLTRISEVSTQAPSGFATAMTTVMLQQWGFDGYIRWLRGIKATYNMRKTWICDAFADTFHLEFNQNKSLFPNGTRTITCYSRQEPRNRWDEKRDAHHKPLVTFTPPTAGMFIFLGVHVSEHPDYHDLVKKGENATQILVQKLWTNLADNLVLFAPGWYFDAGGEHAIGGNGYGYFRLSFSIATYEETYQAVERFAKVLDKFFHVK